MFRWKFWVVAGLLLAKPLFALRIDFRSDNGNSTVGSWDGTHYRIDAKTPLPANVSMGKLTALLTSQDGIRLWWGHPFGGEVPVFVVLSGPRSPTVQLTRTANGLAFQHATIPTAGLEMPRVGALRLGSFLSGDRWPFPLELTEENRPHLKEGILQAAPLIRPLYLNELSELPASLRTEDPRSSLALMVDSEGEWRPVAIAGRNEGDFAVARLEDALAVAESEKAIPGMEVPTYWVKAPLLRFQFSLPQYLAISRDARRRREGDLRYKYHPDSLLLSRPIQDGRLLLRGEFESHWLPADLNKVAGAVRSAWAKKFPSAQTASVFDALLAFVRGTGDSRWIDWDGKWDFPCPK